MKRSSAVTLTAVSMSAFVAGCEQSVETHSYSTVDACIAAKVYSEASCKRSFQNARDQHKSVAPQFANRQECEAEFGADQCSQTNQRSGSSFIFIPIMRGYLMDRQYSNGARVAGQPLYERRTGGYFTAGGQQTASKLGEPTMLKPSKVAKPAPVTRTVARGGFGSGTRSSGSRGFFGG